MIDIQNRLRGRGLLNLFDGKGAPPEHDFGGWIGDPCRHCGATAEMIEDGMVSANVCPRKMIVAIDPAQPDADRSVEHKYYGKSVTMIILDEIEES